MTCYWVLAKVETVTTQLANTARYIFSKLFTANTPSYSLSPSILPSSLQQWSCIQPRQGNTDLRPNCRHTHVPLHVLLKGTVESWSVLLLKTMETCPGFSEVSPLGQLPTYSWFPHFSQSLLIFWSHSSRSVMFTLKIKNPNQDERRLNFLPECHTHHQTLSSLHKSCSLSWPRNIP